MARKPGTFSRRQFLIAGAAASAALAIPWRWDVARSAPMPSSPNLRKYVDPLVIPPTLVLTTAGVTTPISMSESHNAWRFHRDLPEAPRSWGYGGAPYLGPTIEARTGVPITVAWSNNLPKNHIFTLDTTLDWANPSNGSTTPVVPHLHGGFSLPQFDGHPNSWFTTSEVTPVNTGPNFIETTFTYGNEQQAATLWYHDHALGITRLNVHAGLAGFYLLRDAAEDALNLPKGPYEAPIVIQDRILNPDGSLFYPNVGVTAIHPVWVPEFFGDTPVINGKAYPYLEVEPRRYRFRLLNGSNARFYNLWFDDGLNPVPFYQIGTDGGFLSDAAVPVTKLLLAPGERADIIFDFTGMPQGTLLTLKNNAKAPFPGGRGGQVTNLMQFRVTLPLQGTDTTTPAAQLVLPHITPLDPTGATTRDLVLVEHLDPATGEPINAQIEGLFFDEPVTETPSAGSTEVWQFINTTGDAHPMHIHLVEFQILNREPFNSAGYLAAWNAWVAGGRTGTRPALTPFLSGKPVPPAPNEAGRKDTAVAMPGEVLRVVAKFDLPPGEIMLPDGDTNPEYVYHCHILEHEDNEMMRPYEIIS